MNYNLLYKFIENKNKAQQCCVLRNSTDPEMMNLQSLAGVMNDAVFPEPEECCLMKNYQSACPPVIRNFGAYANGGVSKTLHLTHDVFRERIRSRGDEEILSPDNKYIENNYESLLDMQIAENSRFGPLNFPAICFKPKSPESPVCVKPKEVPGPSSAIRASDLSPAVKAIKASEPLLPFRASEPQIGSRALEPQNVTRATVPHIATRAPEPQIFTWAPEPQITTRAPEPQIASRAPEPQIASRAPEPQVATRAPEPQITTRAPEPIVATWAPEASVSYKAPELPPVIRTPEPSLTRLMEHRPLNPRVPELIDLDPIGQPPSPPSQSATHMIQDKNDVNQLELEGSVDPGEDSMQSDNIMEDTENGSTDAVLHDMMEIHDEHPERNVQKSTPMPLSLKITRQVLPELHDEPINQPSPERVYLDFTKKSFVKLVRLSESQIRRASRKRMRSRQNSSRTEIWALESTGKYEDFEIPTKRRAVSKSQTICQMLSRSASLDDDYRDDNDNDNDNDNEYCSSSTEKCESRAHSPENQSASSPDPNSRNEPGRSKVMEFDIFEVPRPQKKMPSNYREKYENRPTVQRVQHKNLSKATQNSTASNNGNRRSGSPRAKIVQKRAYRKTGRYSKKGINGSQTKDYTKTQSGRTAKNRKGDGQDQIQRTKEEIEQEKRKLRNRQNLAKSAQTGCFQIGGDTQHLKTFRIPKKVMNGKQEVSQNDRTSNSANKESNYSEMEFRTQQDWIELRNQYSQMQTKSDDRSTSETQYVHDNGSQANQNLHLNSTAPLEPFTTPPESELGSTTESDQDSRSSSSQSHNSQEDNAEIIAPVSPVPKQIDITNENILPPRPPSLGPPQEIETNGNVNNPMISQFGQSQWEHRLSRPGSMEVLNDENAAEAGGFYYTLGPTNESNQVVQVAEDDSYFTMDPQDHAIECIGEVEVYTSVEENHVPVITLAEPQQTQSGEVTTTTTICDHPPPKVKTNISNGPMLSEEDSRTPPPTLPITTANNLESPIGSPSKKNWEGGSTSEATYSSCDTCSSRSSCSSSDSETEK